MSETTSEAMVEISEWFYQWWFEKIDDAAFFNLMQKYLDGDVYRKYATPKGYPGPGAPCPDKTPSREQYERMSQPTDLTEQYDEAYAVIWKLWNRDGKNLYLADALQAIRNAGKQARLAALRGEGK